MPFGTSWQTLLDECDALGDEATLVTPLTETEFRITDVQEHRLVITETDTGDKEPLQRDQFATLADRISDAGGTFQLQRLPPDAEPYAAVLSLHPRYECDTRAETLTETEDPPTSQLITGTTPPSNDDQDRSEPDLDVYADILLLIDTLERHDPAAFDEWETPVLINLYTLLSDIQRNAGDLRTEVREVLLDRLHHDQPVHGQYGSVQRTAHRNRSLKDDDEVLRALEDEDIPRERVMAVDREKIHTKTRPAGGASPPCSCLRRSLRKRSYRPQLQITLL